MSGFREGLRFALFQAGRGADRVASLSHYVAVGTLHMAEMKAGIRRTWNDFYDTHPAFDAGLLPWEEDLAERFVPSGAQVLLVGCGSGRDLLALAERGCEVTGVEPAASALVIARRMLLERQLSAALVEGFFEDEPIPGAFDVVIFSFYCYAMIPESRRRIEALRKAAALLKPGGHILVSHASTSLRAGRIAVGLGRMMGAVCGSDWRLEAGDLVWDTRARTPAYSYSHTFEAGELEREAAPAGLDAVFQRQSGDTVVAALKCP